MNNTYRRTYSTVLLLCSLVAAPMLYADQSSTAPQNVSQATTATDSMAKLQAEMEAASFAANQATKKGPQDIPLVGQATLKLPAGFGFIPAVESRRLLEAMGNSTDDSVQGLIVPQEAEADWFMVVSYNAAGYIKDDDAKSWNADELLSSIREGTAETNEERKARGIPAMEVMGWIEKPQYKADTHQLVWSLESRSVGQTTDEANGINYNTLALGRDGYISMNLITDTKTVESLKPTAQALLSDLSFDDGKRYSDFNASTDKVAEYGLAALIAGVAAKKLGLLALLAVWLLKFWKIGAILLLGISGLAGKFFKRKEA